MGEKYHVVIADNGMTVGVTYTTDKHVISYRREGYTFSKASMYEIPERTALSLIRKFNFKSPK